MSAISPTKHLMLYALTSLSPRVGINALLAVEDEQTFYGGNDITKSTRRRKSLKDKYPIGSKVTIIGLTDKSELNGKPATVIGRKRSTDARGSVIGLHIEGHGKIGLTSKNLVSDKESDAATSIQSVFKGHHVRSRVYRMSEVLLNIHKENDGNDSYLFIDCLRRSQDIINDNVKGSDTAESVEWDKPPQRRRKSLKDKYPIGSKVTIIGLTDKSELNGKPATVIGRKRSTDARGSVIGLHIEGHGKIGLTSKNLVSDKESDAATSIQSVFKGHHVRSRVYRMSDILLNIHKESDDSFQYIKCLSESQNLTTGHTDPVDSTKPPQRRRKSLKDKYPIGSKVTIIGLTDKSELNGKPATVIGRKRSTDARGSVIGLHIEGHGKIGLTSKNLVSDKESDAATSIQSVFKGHHVRSRVYRMSEVLLNIHKESDGNDYVTCLKRSTQMSLKSCEESSAILRIQCCARKWIATRNRSNLQVVQNRVFNEQELYEINTHKQTSVGTLQRAIRRWLSLKRYNVARVLNNRLLNEEQILELFIQRNNSATQIQLFHRNRLHHRRCKRNHVAAIIQKAVRKFLAVRRREDLKINRIKQWLVEENNEKSSFAARCIQKSVRNFITRKTVRILKLLHERQELENERRSRAEYAAIVVQSCARKFLARIVVNTLLRLREYSESADDQTVTKLHNTIVIQSAVRRFLAQKSIGIITSIAIKLQKQEDSTSDWSEQREFAAGAIQQVVRQHLSRISYTEKLDNRSTSDINYDMFEKREFSAFVIQKAVRMLLAKNSTRLQQIISKYDNKILELEEEKNYSSHFKYNTLLINSSRYTTTNYSNIYLLAKTIETCQCDTTFSDLETVKYTPTQLLARSMYSYGIGCSGDCAHTFVRALYQSVYYVEPSRGMNDKNIYAAALLKVMYSNRKTMADYPYVSQLGSVFSSCNDLLDACGREIETRNGLAVIARCLGRELPVFRLSPAMAREVSGMEVLERENIEDYESETFRNYPVLYSTNLTEALHGVVMSEEDQRRILYSNLIMSHFMVGYDFNKTKIIHEYISTLPIQTSIMLWSYEHRIQSADISQSEETEHQINTTIASKLLESVHVEKSFIIQRCFKSWRSRCKRQKLEFRRQLHEVIEITEWKKARDDLRNSGHVVETRLMKIEDDYSWQYPILSRELYHRNNILQQQLQTWSIMIKQHLLLLRKVLHTAEPFFLGLEESKRIQLTNKQDDSWRDVQEEERVSFLFLYRKYMQNHIEFQNTQVRFPIPEHLETAMLDTYNATERLEYTERSYIYRRFAAGLTSIQGVPLRMKKLIVQGIKGALLIIHEETLELDILLNGDPVHRKNALRVLGGVISSEESFRTGIELECISEFKTMQQQDLDTRTAVVNKIYSEQKLAAGYLRSDIAMTTPLTSGVLAEEHRRRQETYRLERRTRRELVTAEIRFRPKEYLPSRHRVKPNDYGFLPPVRTPRDSPSTPPFQAIPADFAKTMPSPAVLNRMAARNSVLLSKTIQSPAKKAADESTFVESDLINRNKKHVTPAWTTPPEPSPLMQYGRHILKKDANLTVKQLQRNNTPCATLDLENLGWGDKDVMTYLLPLSKNKTITVLKLGGNSLTEDSCLLLSELIRMPSCRLVLIRINDCSLTDSCATILADALSENTSVAGLDLKGNPINAGILFSVQQTLSSRRKQKITHITEARLQRRPQLVA